MKQSDMGTTPIFRQLLERPIYCFSRWVTIVGAIATLIIMLLVTADVLMRRFLNMPITGSYEVSCSLLVIIVSCTIPWVMTMKGHIVVEIVTSKYPQRLRGVIRSIALLVSMIIVGLICWGSMLFGLDQFEIGEVSALLRIPQPPFIFALAFGSALLALVILVQFINSFARSKGS